MSPDPVSIPVSFESDRSERSYEVIVGESLLPLLGKRTLEALGNPAPGKASLIADDRVPADFVQSARKSLTDAGFEVTLLKITALETNKTPETVTRLLTQITESRADRSDPVIALGGGITGDIAGFVSATYKRGVPFIQCPTTLLAMVDASVGGKTGVNLATSTGLKKNIVGSFWQPRLVLADLQTLATLPARVFRAGLGECLKHALLWRTFTDERPEVASLLDADLQTLNAAMARRPDWVLPLVTSSVRIKAAVVRADEREESSDPARSRAILNLGHTFAHAIETLPGIRLPDTTGDETGPAIHHGEAVFLGLIAASATGAYLGLLATKHVETIRQAVEFLGMPTRIENLPDDETILEAMGHDKKASAGRLRLILPVAEEGEPLGRCTIVDDPARDAVAAGLRALRAGD
ncbi:MAG: 3-dehydroquinate synthase family protein [Phycisphaerales bacterium]